MTNEQIQSIRNTVNDLQQGNHQDIETATFALHRHGPSMIPLMLEEIDRLQQDRQKLIEGMRKVNSGGVPHRIQRHVHAVLEEIGESI